MAEEQAPPADAAAAPPPEGGGGEDELKEIADAAHQVEEGAQTLATLLAGQGAKEAAKFFEQCAQGAHQIVQEVPAAPGREPGGEQAPAQEAEAAAAAAPPEGGGGGGDRTPYAEGARSLVKKRG